MTRREILLAQIRVRRQQARLTHELRAPRRRIPPQIHPTAIARSYYRALRDLLKQARAEVRAAIIAPGRLEAWEREAGTWRQDAAGDEVSAALARVSEGFFREFSNERIRRTAEKFARATSDFQKEQLGRQVRAALSVDVLGAEPWLEPRVAAFTAENVALIKSVPARYFSEIESLIIRNVRAGTRPGDIADELEERFSVSEGRARLIARDQTSKFFGELNKERQTDLGVDKAIWRTSGDERVRPSHAAMEGVKFEWADPPTVDDEPAIPGQPINCRCSGEPDFSGVLEELEGA